MFRVLPNEEKMYRFPTLNFCTMFISVHVKFSWSDYKFNFPLNIWTDHRVTRDALKTHQLYIKNDYDGKIHIHVYENMQLRLKDFIYALNSARTKGPIKKVDPLWKGPETVTKGGQGRPNTMLGIVIFPGYFGITLGIARTLNIRAPYLDILAQLFLDPQVMCRT